MPTICLTCEMCIYRDTDVEMILQAVKVSQPNRRYQTKNELLFSLKQKEEIKH